MTTNSLFLQLMRVALGNAQRLDVAPSAEEWSELMEAMVKQGVLGVAFSGVERLPKEQMPPLEVIMDWLAAVDYMEKENLHLNRVNVKVNGMFERDGKRACIIKGASIGVFYPKPLRRSPGDVDVWMAGGYEAVSEYVNKFPTVIGKGHYGRHVEAEIDGVMVEIHFMPAELYGLRHRRYLKDLYGKIEAEPWDCRVELGDCGDIIVPKLEHTLIIAIIHLFSHFAVEGVGMKQVVDCYWVLKAVDKVYSCGHSEGETDAERIRRDTINFFRKTGIGKFVAALMYVLQQLGMDEEQMLCVPDVRQGKRLLAEIQDRGIISANDLMVGKYADESKPHRFYRRFVRAVRLMPMAPSEMFWMLYSGISYWILRRK